MIKGMAQNPIIFTLANPTPEIMPEMAIKAGAFIVATGRSDYPNQINNSLVFPNAFKAMLDKRIPQFDNKIFIKIAIALANVVKNPNRENIIPSMFDKKAGQAVYKAVASLLKK
jgi:malate dehydrogenase (oxaloacetate-decarboxylating)